VLAAPAAWADPPQAAKSGVERAADATGRGLERAADATGRGLERAAGATGRGVKRAVDATGRGLHKAEDATKRGLKKAEQGVLTAGRATGKAVEKAAARIGLPPGDAKSAERVQENAQKR
jgi:hypothetical protein